MRIFALSSRALILIALTAGGAAQASERMSMPFNCQFDGERVQMYPSEERSYEIFGRRESEVYTACSPADPNRCRSWHMHRFDFSCSGVRVPWIDAAAAGARASGRDAWVESGSFHLVMGPMWTSTRPSFGRGGWWRHRYPRDDYGADDGARVVTLPPGYAPALGIPVTFTGTPSSEVAQAPFPPATVTRAPAPKETIPPLPERAPRKQETQPAAAPAVAAKPSAEPAPATAPAAPAAVAATAPAAVESKTPAPTVSIPGSVTPTLINGSGATAAATPTPAAPEFKTEVKVASEAAPAADAPLASAPTETASLPAPTSYDQKTLVMLAGGAAALLTITSVMVGGLWRWSRGPKRLPPPLMHDIASVSLEGAAKGTSLSISPAAPAPAVQAPPPLLPGSAGFGRPDDVPMPTTYAEALDVLGAAPDAALDAIKKIVDGMRQSWHPDLARTEFDRRVRLRRMQQINVAWDLVSQHRSAA
jgi:hypothetical protein